MMCACVRASVLWSPPKKERILAKEEEGILLLFSATVHVMLFATVKWTINRNAMGAKLIFVYQINNYIQTLPFFFVYDFKC